MANLWAWLRKFTTPKAAFDPVDRTANRVEYKRKAELDRWHSAKAKGPLPGKITRAGVEKVLRDLCYTKHRVSPESVFTKTQDAHDIRLFVSLKTLGDTELYAPSQRLSVTASVISREFNATYAEIMVDPKANHAPIASLGQQRFKDFALTPVAVHEIVQQIETEIADINLVGELAKFRALDPSHPGTGGLRHLTALALAGEIDILDGYVRRRMNSDPCGFVPFISDDMIARAAIIGHRHG